MIPDTMKTWALINKMKQVFVTVVAKEGTRQFLLYSGTSYGTNKCMHSDQHNESTVVIKSDRVVLPLKIERFPIQFAI